METNSHVTLMGIFPSVVYGFLLGMDPPKLIHPERQRISILFCLGATLFASLLSSEEGRNQLPVMGLVWALIFLVSALIAKHLFNPETRSYAPLVGISIFTGYLIGIGSWFPALVGTATYLLLLSILPEFLEEWLYGVSLNHFGEEEHGSAQRKQRHTVVYISCAGLFLGAFVVALFQLDQAISDQFRVITAPILPVMKIASHLADAKFMFPICVVLVAAFWIKKKRTTLLPLLGVASWCAGEGVTYLLKHLIGRPRPYLWHQSVVDTANSRIFIGSGGAMVGITSASHQGTRRPFSLLPGLSQAFLRANPEYASEFF